MSALLVSNSSTVALCQGEDNVVIVPRMKPRQKATLARLALMDPEIAYTYAKSFTLNIDRENSVTRGYRSIVRYHKNELKKHGRDNLARRHTNHFLNIFNQTFDCLKSKVPGGQGLGEWVGVEIECFIPGSDKFNELNKSIMALRIPGVEMHRDGSIHPDDYDEDNEEHEDGSEYTPVEFTIVFNRSNPEPLKRLCEFLAAEGALVNKSCGLHVHLDQRDAIEKHGVLSRRISRFRAALPILGQMVSESRRGNTYCQMEVSRRSGDRYYAINLTSLSKHKTIEVRLHSGTTDYTKIINWVELLYAISRQERFGVNPCEFYSDLSGRLTTVSKELMDYVKSRILKHNPRAQLFRDVPLSIPADLEAVEQETEQLVSELDTYAAALQDREADMYFRSLATNIRRRVG